MPLKLKVTEKKPRFFTISLAGSLDTTTHQQLDDKVDQLVNEGAARIITLDMAELTYISSMGVRCVFKAKKALSAQNGSLMMVHLQPAVKKVFEIINALPSVNIFSSMKEMDAYLDRIQNQSTT
jgi:anti-anti-sigma factor